MKTPLTGPLYNLCYYSTIAPFYHIRAKERAKYARLLHITVEQGKNTSGQTYGYWPKQSEKISGIKSGVINPLFDGLTYNTSGHFAHC